MIICCFRKYKMQAFVAPIFSYSSVDISNYSKIHRSLWLWCIAFEEAVCSRGNSTIMFAKPNISKIWHENHLSLLLECRNRGKTANRSMSENRSSRQKTMMQANRVTIYMLIARPISQYETLSWSWRCERALYTDLIFSNSGAKRAL